MAGGTATAGHGRVRAAPEAGGPEAPPGYGEGAGSTRRKRAEA